MSTWKLHWKDMRIRKNISLELPQQFTNLAAAFTNFTLEKFTNFLHEVNFDGCISTNKLGTDRKNTMNQYA